MNHTPRRCENIPIRAMRSLGLEVAVSTILVALLFSSRQPLYAQELFIQKASDGQTIVLPAGQTPAGLPTPAGTPPVNPPAENARPDGKTKDAKVKDLKQNDGKGKPGEANADGTPPTPASPAAAPNEPIKRQASPPEPPNKKEFEVRPDEQGMVQFNFRNQAWPDLLRWLAETSGYSLDWQELPPDYLNIATQRKHTLEEARDLFNRHLLARGYTMLELDGMLQVLKTSGINAALVPKVPPEALLSLPPNRYVRTSFVLDSLIAKEVATEFKPLISANGSLHPLEATNRLEAMDSAANLLEIYRILREEQSEDARSSLAQEFELEFVRATEAKDQLMSFLGLDKGAAPKRAMTPEEQAMLAQQQQMARQNQQQQGQVPPANKPVEIYIVANARRNSIIAHAPPNKMALIAAFVKRLDVPNENAANMQRLETRVKVYRLLSLDPKQLVTSIMAMDALEPTSRLEVDEKNKAIIAYASLSDQLLIQQTIDRLDGSARDFEVIQLRRLRAEDVAGTVKFLMGKEEKNENSSRRFFDPWSGMSTQRNESSDAFRVGANSQDNQLLLWANENEIEEINKLLVKLGELPPEGGNKNRFRTIDASRIPETKEYLKRLQEAWSRVSPNPLILPSDDEFEKKDDSEMPPESEDAEKDSAKPDTDSEQPRKPAADRDSITSITPREPFHASRILRSPSVDPEQSTRSNSEHEPGRVAPPGRLSTAQQPETDPQSSGDKPPAVSNSEPQNKPDAAKSDTAKSGQSKSGTEAPQKGSSSNEASPVEIRFDEQGNLVLSSSDLAALDRLEQMMMSNAPPKRGYETFYIKNARPSWIKWNLEDYFEDEGKGDKDPDSLLWIFGIDTGNRRSSSDPQLGKKRPLRFISDTDTKSLIVIGANDSQLKTIRSLIKLWDIPEKTNTSKLRFTRLVRIEHSKADSIVEAIKDAYRDLLSTNDKAFNKDKGGDGNKDSKHDSGGDGISEGGGMSFSFTGRLSMGIDRVTNSILVSAEGEDLLKLVIEMIKELDEAAQPTGSVQILKLDGTNSDAMEKALKALMRREDPRSPQQQQQQQMQNPDAQQGVPPGTQNQMTPPNGKGRKGRNG